MKSSIIFLTVCFSFFAFHSFSQDFVATGAEWNYDYGPDMGGARGVLTLKYSGDEMIESKMCKRLDASLTWGSVHSPSDTSSRHYGTHYVYKSGDTIFFFNDVDSSFYTLYNFNAQAGDSWQFPAKNCDSLTTVSVDSIGETIINSDTLKTMTLTVKHYWSPVAQQMTTSQHEVIEKIGPLDSYLFLAHNKDCVTDLIVPGPLLCYRDDNFTTYQADSSTPCYYRFVSVEEPDETTAVVYPNPVISALFIQSNKAGVLEVFSSNGKRILKQSIQNGSQSVDFSDFVKGIYFYQIINNKGFLVKTGKLIKNRNNPHYD